MERESQYRGRSDDDRGLKSGNRENDYEHRGDDCTGSPFPSKGGCNPQLQGIADRLTVQNLSEDEHVFLRFER